MEPLTQQPTTTQAWRDQLTTLRYLSAKVAHVHGVKHPDMVALAKTVTALADSPPDDRSSHDALGAQLRSLTGDFKPWAGACGSVYQLFHELAAVVAAMEQGPVDAAP